MNYSKANKRQGYHLKSTGKGKYSFTNNQGIEYKAVREKNGKGYSLYIKDYNGYEYIETVDSYAEAVYNLNTR